LVSVPYKQAYFDHIRHLSTTPFSEALFIAGSKMRLAGHQGNHMSGSPGNHAKVAQKEMPASLHLN
jgi:hypothetical protein